MMFAEVGLNVISHLKQSMDQFAPDMDEHYDLEPGVARPMLSAFDRFAFLLFLLSYVALIVISEYGLFTTN